MPSNPESRTPGDRVVLLLATGLGLGNVPWAPGTFGSLWGPPLVWGLQEAGISGWGWAAAALLIAVLGIPICGRAATILDRKDPGCVVYDEIAAFPIVFAFADINVMTAVLGFGLFRLFDVTKPWPIRRFERLPGGWGIMLDDLLAGVFAGMLLWAIVRWV